MRMTTLAVIVGLIVVASACSDGEAGPLGEGSSGGSACPSIAFLDGRQYLGHHAVVHPVPGEIVGKVRIPECDDDQESPPPPDEWNTVAALHGIDARIAVVDADSPEVIYVRANRDSLPPAIERYFTAPECEAGDAPIVLEGPWLSIPGTDANKEPDPVPPYRVGLLVAETSSSRYVNSELLVSVRPALGMPIMHSDVEESLWEGGSPHLTAVCDGPRFVAESIEVIPPAAT
jgi:hypothetical protein